MHRFLSASPRRPRLTPAVLPAALALTLSACASAPSTTGRTSSATFATTAASTAAPMPAPTPASTSARTPASAAARPTASGSALPAASAASPTPASGAALPGATTPVPTAGSSPAAAAAPSGSTGASPTAAPAATPAVGAPPTLGDDAALEDGFARWVAAFRADARTKGIDDATLRVAFDEARYLPRVVELDRAQPEFTRTVWDYLDSAVSPARVVRGREALAALRVEADAASARHGVPPSVIVAIWGIESNYGSNYGSIPTIDALATLGFEGRRAQWASGQLLAALRILQSGDIDRAHMIGSWAGAMGQTQFLPTNFLAYAIDGDGDGRRDIWGSMADVMASTANFLAQSGWRSGEPWGTEVRLPPGFDVGRADPAQRQSSERWAAEGVRSVDGAPLPPLDDAVILLPGGARGPAFLVGPNFRAILRYNNSTAYALAVSLLAQQLADGPGVQAPWPRDLRALSRSELLALQTALNERGFPSGAPDGMMGPATRDAVRRYQRSVGLPPDGYPDADLLQRLLQPPR